MAKKKTEEREPEAHGWNAIDKALAKIYGKQEPQHWGTVIPMFMGGEDPLQGISAYLHKDGGTPHWHYVSYGLSELYEKESEDPDTSGFGFELTFRLKKDEKDPPVWPASMMQNLARYVFNSGNVFAPGHHLPLNGPIAQEVETDIHAAIMAEDPELGSIKSPNGSLTFVQIVGATMDELASVKRWDTHGMLTLMQKSNPLLVTDLFRKSMLAETAFAQAVEKGIERDGSSTGALFAKQLGFDKRGNVLTIGALTAEDASTLLRGRLGFGRELLLAGEKVNVSLIPGKKFGIRQSDESLEITLPPEAARALAAAIKVQRGDYRVKELPDLTIRVIPSEIKDAQGKKVVKVIG